MTPATVRHFHGWRTVADLDTGPGGLLYACPECGEVVTREAFSQLSASEAAVIRRVAERRGVYPEAEGWADPLRRRRGRQEVIPMEELEWAMEQAWYER